MILTTNFILEPLKLSDAASLCNLMVSNSERFKIYLPSTLSQNLIIENSVVYIHRKNEEHQNESQYTFAIKEKESNAVAGLVILKNIDREKHQAEFAYCIGSFFGGKRLTSKSVLKVVKFATEKLGVNMFQIITHKTNIGSVKVAEKCGFSWKKTLLNEFKPKDRVSMDMELYVLEKS